MATINREGWDEEDNVLVHLESEMGVAHVDGAWVVIDLDEQERGPIWDSAEQAMDHVDREYAANPRHALEW